MRLFFIMITGIFLLSQNLYALACDTNLGKNPRVSDIQRVFDCLNNKIQILEERLERGRSVAPVARTEGKRIRPVRKGAKTIEKSGVLITLEQCSRGTPGRSSYRRRYSSGLYCNFTLQNTTNTEKRLCFGQGSRIVLDNGASFNRLMLQVGASRANIREACDQVPPLVKTNGSISVSRYSRRDRGAEDAAKIQYLVVNCGPGCKHEMYDVPIQ